MSDSPRNLLGADKQKDPIAMMRDVRTVLNYTFENIGGPVAAYVKREVNEAIDRGIESLKY